MKHCSYWFNSLYAPVIINKPEATLENINFILFYCVTSWKSRLKSNVLQRTPWQPHYVLLIYPYASCSKLDLVQIPYSFFSCVVYYLKVTKNFSSSNVNHVYSFWPIHYHQKHLGKIFNFRLCCGSCEHHDKKWKHPPSELKMELSQQNFSTWWVKTFWSMTKCFTFLLHLKT